MSDRAAYFYLVPHPIPGTPKTENRKPKYDGYMMMEWGIPCPARIFIKLTNFK